MLSYATHPSHFRRSDDEILFPLSYLLVLSGSHGHHSDPKSYEKTDQDLTTVIKIMTVTILWTGRDLPTYPERLE